MPNTDRQIRTIHFPISMLVAMLDRMHPELDRAKFHSARLNQHTQELLIHVESQSSHKVQLHLDYDWQECFGHIACAHCGAYHPVEEITVCCDCQKKLDSLDPGARAAMREKTLSSTPDHLLPPPCGPAFNERQLRSLDPAKLKICVEWLRDDLTRHGSKFFTALRERIADQGDAWWQKEHSHAGMGIRNQLRKAHFGEKYFGVQNLDDYYVGIVELAVTPERYPNFSFNPPAAAAVKSLE